MADQTRCLLGLLLLAFRCVLTKVPDAASSQILDYSYAHPEPPYITTDFGSPADDITSTMTIGPRGPVLLQDTLLLEVIGNFDHERIPERVVHAKGAGAFGYFEVTHDITKYTRAKVFERIGKRTAVAMRFSTVAGEVGSADTVRDPRGFAIKFYSDDGTWDLVGNNTPIFFVRDPLLFTVFIHSQKRNPATHLKDPTTYWDFISLRPETLHQIVFMFSDRGIPDGHRHMNGYGSHTYKMVNGKNEAVYVKFHFKTNQGIKNLPVDVAANLTATDPDYGIRDLYNAIANKKYPSWTLYIQVMTFEEAENFRWNPFDLTKVWPHGEFPLIPVGKLILNKNPTNYFAEVEQIAFNPAHMIPGIEPSPDKMLQARLFSYTDTQRHRLGPNYKQLPVNCPLQKIANYHRDGLMLYDSQEGAPNYHPNSFGGPINKEHPGYSIRFNTTGDVGRYNSKDEDNFSQPRLFWRNVLKPEERDRLVDNIVNHLKLAVDLVQERTVKVFSQIDPVFGSRILEGLQISSSM